MRLTSQTPHLVPFLVFACAGPARQPEPPAPEAAQQKQTVQNPSGNFWAFSYAPGLTSYRITRSAVVENVSSPNPTREITSNLTHEMLGLERIGDTLQFTIVVDTFSTTTQNLVGPAQSSVLPIRISGTLVHDTLQITSDTAAVQCSPSQSAIKTDIHNLVVPFPARLERGMVWADSLEVVACQAMVPTTARVRRTFQVSGETSYDGSPAIVIERRDIIQAHGEGAQQQHRIILEATGDGSVLYYLSPSSGQVLHVAVEQNLTLAITASGKVDNFRQKLKQEFALVR